MVSFPAGIPKLPLNLVLLKSCDVRGIFWGAFATRQPACERANVERLVDWWTNGKITPRIDRTFPLARGGEAIASLAAREVIGKVVVIVGAGEKPISSPPLEAR